MIGRARTRMPVAWCTAPCEHRRAQLVQSGEGELHLGLDAPDLGDEASRGPLARVVQQGRLSHPGLAAQDQHRTSAGSDPLHQAIQCLALAVPTAQSGPGMAVVGHSHDQG